MNKFPRLSLWWPLTFGVGIGLEVILGSLILFGPDNPDSKIAATLTLSGLAAYRPEYDVEIYIKGCIFTALLVLAMACLWNRRVKLAPDTDLLRITRRGVMQIGICLSLFLLNVAWLLSVRWWFVLVRLQVPLFPAVILYLFPALTFLLATAGWKWGVSEISSLRFPRKPATKFNNPNSIHYRSKQLWVDLLVAIFLCAVIYIPSYRNVAGHCFLEEEFHHWNFFAMAPTLAFKHGGALCTDYYAQYGVGWPLLYNALSGLTPISYSGMIHLTILYGCIYFAGLYWLLRLMLQRPDWAAAGVVFTLVLQLFHGNFPNDILWRYPSSTVIRSTMDIWFFMALLFHIRSGNKLWALVAGALVGVAILFETDTGIYLAVTFAGYWTYSLGLAADRPLNLSKTILIALLSFAIALGILLSGLYVASRGTLFHKQFWTGWLETLISFGAGFMMIPVAVVPDGTLLLFILFIALYLGAVGVVLIKLLTRQSNAEDVLLGTIASYGLVLLLLFIGRSHPFNIYHVAVPFGIVVCVLIARTVNVVATHLESRQHSSKPHYLRSAWVPITALACSVTWLWLTPSFQEYPNIIKSLTGAAQPEGLCLIENPPDVCGLPVRLKDYVSLLQALTRRLHEMHMAGQSVAILDDADTVYYYASDCPPWTRYSPSFAATGTRSALADLKNKLLNSGPEIVVIRGNDARARVENAQDVWLEMHQAVQAQYTLETSYGPFELWRRNKG